MPTENTPKGALLLLTEAARIAVFPIAGGWPIELRPRQLAALMAGGLKADRRQAFYDWRNMINAAIESNTLATRVEKLPARKEQRTAKIPGASDWRTIDGSPVRTHYGYEVEVTPEPLHHINRDAVAAWFRTENQTPSEHVRAWLGHKWQTGDSLHAAKQPSIDLYKAAEVGDFLVSDGWPNELTTYQLAGLMAGVKYRHDNAANIWVDMLHDAVDAARLRSRHVPITNSPDDALIFFSARMSDDYITREALAEWLPTTNEKPNAHVRAWLGNAWRNGEAETAPHSVALPEPKSSKTSPIDRRVTAIIAMAKKMKYQLGAIPYRGKKLIKNECCKDATNFTSSTFDKAWSKASTSGKIAHESKDIYSKR